MEIKIKLYILKINNVYIITIKYVNDNYKMIYNKHKFITNIKSDL
jgi:hypothetical protein